MKISLFPTLKNYKKEYFGKDLTAGIMIAAVSIPISMGYAEVSGLPAVFGLYGSVLPILFFALFSTSPHFSDLQEGLLKDESPKIKIFLNNLIHLLNHHVLSQDVKFIPFEMMHSLIALEQFTKEDYLKAYQITTKALKYLQDKTVVKEEYLQMRLNVFTMLAGEKDVE